MQTGNLRELISPEQSGALVLYAAIALTLLGAGLGFWAARARGLVAGLCGPLMYGLWVLHGALTARFGMDSLALLLGEVVGFVALGVALGWFWSRLVALK